MALNATPVLSVKTHLLPLFLSLLPPPPPPPFLPHKELLVVVMGDHNSSKSAGKAFVDSSFPLKKPACEVLDQVLPPNPTQESSRKQGSADGHSQTKPGKTAVIVYDTDSDPSLMSLGVNYGARDYYHPCPSSSRNTGNSYEHVKQKDKKDGLASDSHEWWQGSYHY